MWGIIISYLIVLLLFLLPFFNSLSGPLSSTMSFRYFIFACVDNFSSFNSSCQTILTTNVVMYLKACWVSCKYIVVMHLKACWVSCKYIVVMHLKACWVSCKYIVVMHFHLSGSILQMHCCHAVWSMLSILQVYSSDDFHLFGSILQMHCCHAVRNKHYLIMHCYACLVSCKNFVVKQCQAFCHTFVSCTLTVDFYDGQIGHKLFCFFHEL